MSMARSNTPGCGCRASRSGASGKGVIGFMPVLVGYLKEDSSCIIV